MKENTSKYLKLSARHARRENFVYGFVIGKTVNGKSYFKINALLHDRCKKLLGVRSSMTCENFPTDCYGIANVHCCLIAAQ